eukprot:168629-Pleurochrysis_carterae.AAC.1
MSKSGEAAGEPREAAGEPARDIFNILLKLMSKVLKRVLFPPRLPREGSGPFAARSYKFAVVVERVVVVVDNEDVGSSCRCKWRKSS